MADPSEATAAEAPGADGGPDPAGSGAQAADLPSLAEAQSWIGHKLDDLSGGTVGRVEGVFVDSVSGEPSWLVLRVGRFGRRSALPYEFAAAGVGHVWVPYSKDAIRRSPDVDPDAGLDHALEQELCDHYGIPAGSRRRAAIAGREDEGFTSVPAPR